MKINHRLVKLKRSILMQNTLAYFFNHILLINYLTLFYVSIDTIFVYNHNNANISNHKNTILFCFHVLIESISVHSSK